MNRDRSDHNWKGGILTYVYVKNYWSCLGFTSILRSWDAPRTIRFCRSADTWRNPPKKYAPDSEGGSPAVDAVIE